MSGIGAALVVLDTHPKSFAAILLLRTYAIYSGSKRVTIPLTIIYVVRPRDSFRRGVQGLITFLDGDCGRDRNYLGLSTHSPL